MADLREGADLNMNFGLSASAKSRHNLTLQHLWNARHAASQCRDREADLTSLNYRLPEVELNGAAMVAVISSVAFLEALVNDVYLNTVDPESSTDRLKGMSDSAIAAMRDRWKAAPSVEREGVLQKYKVALECIGMKMALSREPSQSVKILVDLRDALTHYKPELQGDDDALFAELKKKLPVNARVAEVNPWFPHQAPCADCAEWAWKSTGARRGMVARYGLGPRFNAEFARLAEALDCPRPVPAAGPPTRASWSRRTTPRRCRAVIRWMLIYAQCCAENRNKFGLPTSAVPVIVRHSTKPPATTPPRGKTHPSWNFAGSRTTTSSTPQTAATAPTSFAFSTWAHTTATPR